MNANLIDDDLLGILLQYNKIKKDYQHYKEECKELKTKISRLQDDLQEAEHSEKAHRSDLVSSREIIKVLQNTITNLADNRAELRKAKEELELKTTIMTEKEEDKKKFLEKYEQDLENTKAMYDDLLNGIKEEYEKRIYEIQNDADIKIAQSASQASELNAKIKHIENQAKERINCEVLDYEDKLARAFAQLSQARDALAAALAQSNASEKIYKKEIEELRQRLKEYELKQRRQIGIAVPQSSSYLTSQCYAPGAQGVAESQTFYAKKAPNRKEYHPAPKRVNALQPIRSLVDLTHTCGDDSHSYNENVNLESNNNAVQTVYGVPKQQEKLDISVIDSAPVNPQAFVARTQTPQVTETDGVAVKQGNFQAKRRKLYTKNNEFD